ncbi:unnamed protein product [Effrenium voratum]|nr:unnamed protein product [Effrenium voratum]
MGTFEGVIKSFNPQKGWGFITSPEAGGDLLLLRTELGSYAVSPGDKATFTAKQTPKGLQATDVRILPAEDGTMSFVGTVKSFNPEKAGEPARRIEALRQLRSVWVALAQF